MPFARLSYGLLTSQDQGGGDKKQGLPPIVGLGHFSINIIRRKSWPSSSSFTKVSSDKCSLYFAKQTGSNRPGTVAMSFFYNLNAFTGNYVITNNINSFTNFIPPTNYRGFLLVNTSNCSINTTIPKSILQSSSNNNIRIKCSVIFLNLH